jgi:BASS family bile acid:Na+ symporter
MWLNQLKNLLRNRNSLLVLSLILGLLWGEGAQWIKGVILPVLMILMTVSTLGVTGSTFSSPRSLWGSALVGVGMNYAVLTTFILALNALLVRDTDLRIGFVILAVVPPAVAVVPFTLFLGGNNQFSLLGMIGAYLGALVIAPALAFLLLGSGIISPSKLILIIIELILAPLVLSRILLRVGLDSRLESVKGPITNWGFFLVSYAVVGLNRETILSHPLSLLPAALIAVASTFLLSWIIERIGKYFRVEPKTLVSLVLLGTLKNYGLAGGMALALFSEKTSVPATVSSVFMIVYIIWLESKKRRAERGRIG